VLTSANGSIPPIRTVGEPWKPTNGILGSLNVLMDDRHVAAATQCLREPLVEQFPVRTALEGLDRDLQAEVSSLDRCS
jgi:hypothetical protein